MSWTCSFRTAMLLRMLRVAKMVMRMTMKAIKGKSSIPPPNLLQLCTIDNTGLATTLSPGSRRISTYLCQLTEADSFYATVAAEDVSTSDIHEHLMKLFSIEYGLAILPVSLSHLNGKAECRFCKSPFFDIIGARRGHGAWHTRFQHVRNRGRWSRSRVLFAHTTIHGQAFYLPGGRKDKGHAR